MSAPTPPTATATITVAADPERVYSLVSDLPSMGQLSPEATGGRWIGKVRGPAVGARFVGVNRAPGRWWPMTSLVTDASPGRRFAFQSKVGPVVAAEWVYDITPTDAGCEVTESWYDRRSGPLATIGRFVTGVADREGHTQSMLESTLAKLKETAEAGA